MITIQEATVSSQGQVTIPAEIRRHLGLEKGRKVQFILDDDGTLRMRVRKTSPKDVVGSLVAKGPTSIDLDKEIEEAMAIELLGEATSEAAGR